VYCRRHGGHGDAGDDGDQDEDRQAAFRARLAAGDFDAVLGPGLREVLRGAAADPGLDAEIGALRVALARLLEDERDASRLAAGVARVAGVAVQAARLRHGGETAVEEVLEQVRRGLAAYEAELAGTGGKEVMADDSG
jgi:hypothetical protein